MSASIITLGWHECVRNYYKIVPRALNEAAFYYASKIHCYFNGSTDCVSLLCNPTLIFVTFFMFCKILFTRASERSPIDLKTCTIVFESCYSVVNERHKPVFDLRFCACNGDKTNANQTTGWFSALFKC